jgi:hypothetical protein
MEIIETIVNLLKMGNYITVVCDYVGIHQSTFFKWMAEGEKATSGLKRELFERVKKAESYAEIQAVASIRSAAEQDWKANAWFLERKYSTRWGRKEKVEMGGVLTTQNVEMTALNDEELLKIVKRGYEASGFEQPVSNVLSGTGEEGL